MKLAWRQQVRDGSNANFIGSTVYKLIAAVRNFAVKRYASTFKIWAFWRIAKGCSLTYKKARCVERFFNGLAGAYIKRDPAKLSCKQHRMAIYIGSLVYRQLWAVFYFEVEFSCVI